MDVVGAPAMEGYDGNHHHALKVQTVRGYDSNHHQYHLTVEGYDSNHHQLQALKMQVLVLQMIVFQ